MCRPIIKNVNTHLREGVKKRSRNGQLTMLIIGIICKPGHWLKMHGDVILRYDVDGKLSCLRLICSDKLHYPDETITRHTFIDGFITSLNSVYKMYISSPRIQELILQIRLQSDFNLQCRHILRVNSIIVYYCVLFRIISYVADRRFS